MTVSSLRGGQRVPRHGQLPVPMLIALVLAAAILGFVVLNWYFYGKPVAILEQRVVLADIEDFSQFVLDCTTDPSSSHEIVTMRDDPDGNFVLLRLQVLLSFIYQKVGTQTGQIVLRRDDFSLVSGTQTWAPVLLGSGYEARTADGSYEFIIRSLALRRGPDGAIEQTDAGASSQQEKPTLGDLVRGVKQLHGAATVGAGGSRHGVLDWVRAPLDERSRIIQPPGLSGYVWRAELRQDRQDAWRAAEAICLFPLPHATTSANLIVFGDKESAIPITWQ